MTQEVEKGSQTYDVVIVGGGIAGLYCLYRLLKNGGYKRIKLFESCDHLGGRIETWSLKRALRGKNETGFDPAWDPRHLLGDQSYQDVSPYDGSEYFRAEFGPMRIEPRDQPLLEKLLKDVGIMEPAPGAPESLDDLIPFFSYAAEDPQSPTFTLKGEEAEQKTPIDLLLLGIRRILEIIDEPENQWKDVSAQIAWKNLRSGKSFYGHYWKSELLDWINHLQDFVPNLSGFENHEDSDYETIRNNFTINQHRLWDMGFWNLMSDVLSHYAVVKIRDWGTYYHFLHENLNAAEWLIFWLKAIKGTRSLRGIRGGMSRLIYTLLFELCKLYDDTIGGQWKKDVGNALTSHCGLSHEQANKLLTYQKANSLPETKRLELLKKGCKDCICVKWELTGLKLRDGNIECSFINRATAEQNEETVTVLNHVILALPKRPLEKLNLPNLFKDRSLTDDSKQIEASLATVKCLPLLKCFFIVENPWWEDDRRLNKHAADVPTREMSYHKSKDKTKGMIMIYTDHPAITFWSDYLREFEKAAEDSQFHYTVWWKTSWSLPSRVEDFENDEWLELAELWLNEQSAETRQSLTNEYPGLPKKKDEVSKVWSCIVKWWAGISHTEQEKHMNSGTINDLRNYLRARLQQKRIWDRFVQFARDYEHHDFSAERLLACGMRDWGKEPFGAAAHGWLPGVKSREHIKYLAAFPNKETSVWNKKLHICGEAFSDYQGFIEGALRSAEETLKQIGIPSLKPRG